MSGTTDKIKGRVKEAIGALTDDDSLKAEGKMDQKTGKIKDAVEKVIDKARNAVRAPKSK
ncbi:MAG TPA: CsbD family protein [Candidatus Binataceae bacterium]|nr:CsbD family protein [Candidatus Binataceae bacterium]